MSYTGVEYLNGLNEIQASDFVKSRKDRREYRLRYPTEVAVFKCMDGRVHLPIITRTPPGIIQCWRNIGANFDLNWRGFRNSVGGLWGHAKGNSRPVLWAALDHYSQSGEKLGCRGHDFDTKRARAASRRLRNQFHAAFYRYDHSYAIHLSVETDQGGLIIHGERDGELNLGKLAESETPPKRTSLREDIHKLCPMAPGQILNDLTELAFHNVQYVRDFIRQKPLVEKKLDHGEWVLGVGQGFDWLYQINTALLVSPFDPQFPCVVRDAAKILLGNIQRSDFQVSRGLVLLASAPFRPAEKEKGRRAAQEKARTYGERALRAIRNEVPELVDYLRCLTVIVDMETMRFSPVD